MHPLQKFSYCPVCGSDRFTENNFKSKRCRQCGFTYYANPSAATAAFITRADGQLLVARRGKEPAKGTLDLPGGFVDMDETVEQGMAREILEETGLSAENMTYLFSRPNHYLYSDMLIHTIDMFFAVSVPQDARPAADDDAAELMWMPAAQIDASLFGLESIRWGVEQWLAKTIQQR